MDFAQGKGDEVIPLEGKESQHPQDVAKQEESAPVEVQEVSPVLTLEKIQEMVERKDRDILEAFGGVEGLMGSLNVEREKGVLDTTLVERREKWGANELSKKEPVRFIDFLLDALSDKIEQILIVAAIVSIIFGLTLPNPYTGQVDRGSGWINGVAIIISVMIVAGTNSINNYQKALKFQEMEAEQNIRHVSVIRNGSEHNIDSTEVVVGDIMILEGGVQLTCDGVFLDGTDLKTNESAMTGESDIIKKSADKDCFFLSGTLLEEGQGHMLVIAVGMGSYQGKMKESLDEESGETPLQEKLDHLADKIGIFGFGGSVLMVAALSIKEGILIGRGDKDFNISNFLNFVIIAITLVVVAIPEGLSLAVTISLAFGMKAMADDNCLVRVLASCETMGAATAICSDKTGTLTTNVMTVVQGLIADEEFVIQGYGLVERHDGVTKITRESPAFSTTPTVLERFCYAMALNSSAREQEVDGKVVWLGNKTEHGLLGFINFVKLSYKGMRESVPDTDKRQFPFNSKKKRMTTLVRDADGVVTCYCKGASEVILDDCDKYMLPDGSIADLTPAKRQQFQDVINDMANQGNRTIGVAQAGCHFAEFPEEEPSLSMTFLGVMGIQDPIREAVPGAVLRCHSAGLIIRMVTGDNINTAIAIAKKCNIYSENGWDLAMTGKELREIYDEAQNNADVKQKMMDMLPRLRIMARSSPSDKHILVGLLQEIGEVVGVTGDGTNDAPALKLADVGFAMNTGTDIAKGAADMVLVDDNFASVVNAIRWGRAVNDNIRKFLQFQLSINVSGVLLTFVGALVSATSKEPFTAVQLLWLNLIMDTMAALALATETPEEACLTRPPVYKQAPLISNKMWAFIIFHGSWQFALIMVLLFLGHDWFNTIEVPGSCDYNWPSLRRNVTVFRNVSGRNVTDWEMRPLDMEKYCVEVCEETGGVFYYSNNRCQQGPTHSTIIFNTFIFSQIFNIFNARKIYGEINPFEGILTRSKKLIYVFGFILAFQTIAVCLFDKFMGVTLLQPGNFFICVAIGLLELILGFLPRFLPITDYVPDEVTKKKDKEEQMRSELQKHQKAGFFTRSDSSLRRSNSLMFTKTKQFAT
jgi:Ca2+-transporting ATPase